MTQRLKDFPWYPILIGAYPVLTLFNANLGEARFEAAQRALLLSTALGWALYAGLWLFFRDAKRAAFQSFLWLALIFTYGHTQIYLEGQGVSGGWVRAAWSALFIASLYLGRRPSPTASLNAAALFLVVTSALQIGAGQGQGWGDLRPPDVTGLSAPANPPDVYYIIFDSYGRADALQAAYGYDNSEFLDALRARGFYIAEKSRSNYVRTALSMTSSLNLQYLQDLDAGFAYGGQAPRRSLWDAIQHSAVRRGFEGMGYRSIGFATGFPWNEVTDADVYYAAAHPQWELNEFEYLFLRTTAFQPQRYVANQRARERFEHVFNHLGEVAEMPEATFAYIHIIPPHPPFIYDAAGRAVDEDLPYAAGYPGQLQWLNQKALAAVDELLAKSERPPLIVLQGDHGAEWAAEILNAYYLPGCAGNLYADITPVNTFRLIYNDCYGGEYPLLADKTYASASGAANYELTELGEEK